MLMAGVGVKFECVVGMFFPVLEILIIFKLT